MRRSKLASAYLVIFPTLPVVRYFVYVKFLFGVFLFSLGRVRFSRLFLVSHLFAALLVAVPYVGYQDSYLPAYGRFFLFPLIFYLLGSGAITFDFRVLFFANIILLADFLFGINFVTVFYSAVGLVEIDRFTSFLFNHIDGGLLGIIFVALARVGFARISDFSALFVLVTGIITLVASGSKMMMIFGAFILVVLWLRSFLFLLLAFVCFLILYFASDQLPLFRALGELRLLLLGALSGDHTSLSVLNRLDDYATLVLVLKDPMFLLLGAPHLLEGGNLIEVGFVSNVVSYGLVGSVYFYFVFFWSLRRLFSLVACPFWARFAFTFVVLSDFFINLTQSLPSVVMFFGFFSSAFAGGVGSNGIKAYHRKL